KVGIEDKYVYKTLVLENSHHQHFVFIIPVSDTLDMKAAANAVNENKLQLMYLDELKKVTCYNKVVCSSNRIKKQFKTIIDQQAKYINSLYISGGERGVQIEITVDDLIKITNAKVLNVTHQ